MIERKRILTTFAILCLLLFSALSLWAQSGGAISYGEVVNGTISDDDPLQRWTFTGKSGEVVTIRMEASDSSLDSYLQLLDADDTLLVENDDASNTTIDAMIEAFTLPADGVYTIIATRFGLESGLAEGDYRLTLEQITPGGSPTAEEGEPIAYNQRVDGTLNRQNFEDRWVFQGQVGDFVTIRMERSDNSDLDSFLRLIDNEGRELARNDDGEDGIRSSEIVDFELPYSGTYTIVATRYGFESGTSSGGYELEVMSNSTGEMPTEEDFTISDPVSVRYGDFVQGAISDNQLDVYEFNGRAGELVTISVKRASGDLDPLLGLLDEDFDILIENDNFNGVSDARIVDFELPADGLYTIAVIVEVPSQGDYVLHLFEKNSQPSAAPQPEVEPTQTTEPEPLDLSNATLVITLAWEGTADFDLLVRDPNGDVLDYISTETAAGGHFGGDANGGCASASSAPSETAYWEATPPSGSYTIDVAHVFPCEAESPVAFSVEVSLAGEVLETFSGELNEGGLATYVFDLD